MPARTLDSDRRRIPGSLLRPYHSNAPSYASYDSYEYLISFEERPVETVEASTVRVRTSIVPEQDPSTASGPCGSPDSDDGILPSYGQVLLYKGQEHLSSASELDPEAGTLGLTVNGGVRRRVESLQHATADTSQARPPVFEPPSALIRAFLGRKRADERARRRAERRAARLEQIHDAWARLGVNTRDLLARGGTSALPPYFKNPPRCTWEEMMAQV